MASDILTLLEQEWSALAVPGGRYASDPRRKYAPLVLAAQLEELVDRWEELTSHASILERYVTSEWTVRQLFAHLASWAAEFRKEIETVAEGRTFDYAIPFAMSVIGPAQWNQAEVERRGGASLEEVREEYLRETRRIEDLVLTLDAATLNRFAEFPPAPTGDPSARMRMNIGMLVSGKCMHDRYHLDRVSEIVGRLE